MNALPSIQAACRTSVRLVIWYAACFAIFVAIVVPVQISDAADPPKSKLKKGDPPSQREVSPAELLQFVCSKDEAWSMDQIPLFESITGPKGKGSWSAAVPEAKQPELASRIESKDPWPMKLLFAIDHTPLYLRIVCRREDQPQIADVIAKFGEPVRKQKATIYSKNGSTQGGEWYYYGKVRLGVHEEGRILSAQIDSPKWIALCQEVDEANAKAELAAEAKKAAAKLPPKQIDPEAKAASELKLSKALQKSNPAAARRRLQELIQDFPDTKAAIEAKTLLGDQ